MISNFFPSSNPDYSTLILSSNSCSLMISCDFCDISLAYKNVSVLGVLDSYNNSLILRANKILVGGVSWFSLLVSY